MFKSILHRLFPSGDVRDTVRYIKIFLKDYESVSKDTVKRKSIVLARQPEKTIKFITEDKHHPEHLALLLVTKVIGRELPKLLYDPEQQHQVRNMMKMWDAATLLMLKRRYYSDVEYRKDCEWIDGKCKFLRTNVTPDRMSTPDLTKAYSRIKVADPRSRKRRHRSQ